MKLTVALSALSLSVCRRAPEPPEAEAGAPTVVLGEENLFEVTRQTISTGPLISGTIEPRARAVVLAEASGTLAVLTAELGDTVKRGQTIARVEAPALGQAVAAARSAVRSAEQAAALADRETERTERLAHSGAVAQAALEQAVSAQAQAAAGLAEARSGLAMALELASRATVRAPMDGVVSERPANQGDTVIPGTHIVTVIDPETMRLEARVAADALPLLEIGRAVVFEVRGHPGAPQTGHIEQIAPAADPATRQITILVAIPNPEQRLLAGMYAEGRVEGREQPGLVVPHGALRNAGERPTVLRVRGGRIEEVPVMLGVRDEVNERVEVVSGLVAGDSVVMGDLEAIVPGARVKVERLEPAAGQE